MFVVGYADGRTAYITISPKALERVNDDPRAVSVTVQGRATGAYVSVGKLNASNDDEAKAAAVKLVKTKLDDLDLDDWVSIVKDGGEIEPRSVAHFVRNP